MMDSVGEWLYVVEMMWMCVRAMWLSISLGVHDFLKVANCELCCVGFKRVEAVSEVGCGAVEGCAG
jgi:hypothetical protein